MGNQVQILRLRPSQFKPNSVVIVTGASSGIGKELAFRYAKRNCNILLAARSETKLKEVQQQCQQLGGTVQYFVCDVTQEKDCKALIDQCIKLYGRIDIMLLCAGINAHSRFEDIKDLSIFQKIMETNLYGYVYTTKYALPHLKQSKGQIVVMSSMSGEIGQPSRTAYCASKFAVTGFFESLRTEINQKEIALTLICPPSVKTPMREHDILKPIIQQDQNSQAKADKRIEIKDCVDMIMLAADKRARKVFFPLRVYLAAYVRPFFPDFIDNKVKKEASL